MKTEFKILTREEEKELTQKELKEYYINLRNYLSKRKLTNTTIGATTISPKLRGLVNKHYEKETKKIKMTYEGQEDIPSERVIFVHSCVPYLNKTILINKNDRHCLLFGDKESNKILLLQQLVNGLIIDSKGNDNAKLDAIRLLLEGNSISCFVDNYNLKDIYDNPTNSFIDIAKKAGVPIVPVVHDIKYIGDRITKIHTIYEEVIYIDEYDDLLDKLKEYEDIIFPFLMSEAEKEQYNRKRRVLSK